MASIDCNSTLLWIWKSGNGGVVAAYLQADLKHEIYVIDKNEEGDIEYWLLHTAFIIWF